MFPPALGKEVLNTDPTGSWDVDEQFTTALWNGGEFLRLEDQLEMLC
jgi:hypothetical protein